MNGDRSRSVRRAGVLAAALLVATVAVADGLFAQAPTPSDGADPAVGQFVAGERLAEAVAIATGVPISPLLGVSALGAYRWWRAPPAVRQALPWYSRPAFWGAGLALALLFALNTTIGGLIPGLKKPMDFVEQFENQFSGLLASPIVVLEIVRLLEGVTPALTGVPPGAWTSSGLAALGVVPEALAPLVRLGTGALALGTYAVVFLAFHAIQVLIALSPSALLDLALRGFRLSILAVAGMAASIHPYVGAAFGLLLVAIALPIAGWSFRLMVFGSVFGRDLLVGGPAPGDGESPTAFAGGGLKPVPVRARGRVTRAGDELRFVWRPWLVMPARSRSLPAGVALRRGTLSPSICLPGGVREPTLVRFSPRHRRCEAALAERLGLDLVVDGRLVRGFHAACGWLRDLTLGRDGASETGP